MTSRSRGDLCPGVLRPGIAQDGAVVRLRTPGGQTTRTRLTALIEVAETHGDGEVHLTDDANLEVRGLPVTPATEALPGEVVQAIRATGLFGHPTHELVRNILASPLTGLSGGRADLRPVVAELDERLCSRPSLAGLPPRFVFVLDDGRGDLADRRPDLGLVALDDTHGQLRIGSHHWGRVVPLARAAVELVTLARTFLRVRGHGPEAAGHVDDLPATPAGQPRQPRAAVSSDPPAYGAVTTGVVHHEVTDGVLDRTTLAGLPESLVVTPWRSLVAVA